MTRLEEILRVGLDAALEAGDAPRVAVLRALLDPAPFVVVYREITPTPGGPRFWAGTNVVLAAEALPVMAMAPTGYREVVARPEPEPPIRTWSGRDFVGCYVPSSPREHAWPVLFPRVEVERHLALATVTIAWARRRALRRKREACYQEAREHGERLRDLPRGEAFARVGWTNARGARIREILAEHWNAAHMHPPVPLANPPRLADLADPS